MADSTRSSWLLVAVAVVQAGAAATGPRRYQSTDKGVTVGSGTFTVSGPFFAALTVGR